MTSCRLLHTVLGWIPAPAASVIEGGCWGHLEERLAKEGKGWRRKEGGGEVCGREDVQLGPDTDFYLFLPLLELFSVIFCFWFVCFFKDTVFVFIVCKLACMFV